MMFFYQRELKSCVVSKEQSRLFQLADRYVHTMLYPYPDRFVSNTINFMCRFTCRGINVELKK